MALWVVRGFGVLTFLPGGVIGLLFVGAILMAIGSYVQKTWLRY